MTSGANRAVAGAAGSRAALPSLAALYRSEDFRQAVRVALAMVIAYYVSLTMGWERPYWAGLAVAMCSLGTVGDSLNKGMLRILGTVLAGAVAIGLAASFPQDRWHYMLGATLYIALCGYMMGLGSRWYFWYVAGFVMALVALAGGPESVTEFEIIVLRLKQTVMGVTAYLLVATLLWPRRATPRLEATLSGLAEVHAGLIAHYVAHLTGGTHDADDAAKARARAAATAAALPGVVDGAEVDSMEVWGSRRLWRRCAEELGSLQAELERWRHGFPELEKLDLGRLTPGLSAFGAELQDRLTGVGRMLAGEAAPRDLAEMVLEVDEDALGSVGRFDRAAVLRLREQIHRIEQVTRRLSETVAAARGVGPDTPPALAEKMASPAWTIDPDRLAAAVRVFALTWLILLAAVYVPGLPMPTGLVSIVISAGLMLGQMPAFPVRKLIVPGLAAAAAAGGFHVLVMPHLSSFAGLGAGIFIAVFLLFFLLAKPEHAIPRSLGASLFVVVSSVKVEQTYSILLAVNYALLFLVVLIALWVSSWLPISFRPQRAVFKQLDRFLRSCVRLCELPPGEPEGQLMRMSLAYHQREVTVLPARIGMWMRALPAVAQRNVTPEQAQALEDGLQALSDRMRELVELRRAGAMLGGLDDDVDAWRRGIQRVLHTLATDPASVDAGALRSQVGAVMEALESRIQALLDAAPEGSVSSGDLDHTYLSLGAYRGVSEAVTQVVERAAPIDWQAARYVGF